MLCFNASLAGVFFAMELILRDFTAESFDMVVLASVTASVIGRGAFGSAPFLHPPAFTVPHLIGGSYELANTSFYVPLIRGDRVTAELDSFSCLQVTALERPAPFVLTVVMSKTPVSQAEMTDMGRLLEDAGTSVSEGHAGVFVTTWDQPGSLEDVTSVVASLLAKDGGWRLTEAHEPAGRFDLARDDLDLDLDRSVPHTFETDYWAPDDP